MTNVLNTRHLVGLVALWLLALICATSAVRQEVLLLGESPVGSAGIGVSLTERCSRRIIVGEVICVGLASR